MENFYIPGNDKIYICADLYCYKKAFLGYLVFIIFIFSNINSANAQGVIPTKGKDFWIGFPYNPQFSNSFGSKRCDVFITSSINTSGIISIPQQGWSQAFTVTANVSTNISIPTALVEHVNSEILENRGVEIITQDDVNVFAISFQKYTADATVIYPKHSLGTSYRVSSYKGLSNSSPPNLSSDLLIVATEDATQIAITPSAPTLAGKPQGIPFIVNLNAGQSYQVIASSANDDLTGTVIQGTNISGSCRPFAVFSGGACVNIPSSCAACDIIYEQSLPVEFWGKTYYAVPFSFATTYTIRILADQNNTFYTINGGPIKLLNAGQFTEINSITGTLCIVGSKPISVIQYMEGVTCAGAGDPSMMYLNAQEQKIDEVTFSTVTSSVINQHDVNVIMNTADINQLKLDGVPVSITQFSPMAYCTSISSAHLPLTQGSHTLKADSGFTAYVYGTGSAESYAYSVGSYNKNAPIKVDSVLCSNDTIHLGTTNSLYNSWWSTLTNPNDTIGVGLILILVPPRMPDIYIQHANEFISGCDKLFYFDVEIPNPPTTSITSNSNIVCSNQHVQLGVTTNPISSNYQYTWTPSFGLNNPNISNPVLIATTSAWYKVAVNSINGCANTVYDSIYIEVLPLPLPNASASGNQSICLGNSVTISASGGINYLWQPNGSIDSVITVIPTATTNYVVYVSDTNGCQNSDTVLVTVKSLPLANAGLDVSICKGASTTLNASGGISYLWSLGGQTTSSITVAPSTSTNYLVQVTAVNGCNKNDSVNVFVKPLPIVSAGVDQTICKGDSVNFIAVGGVLYLWSPGGNTTSAIVKTPLISSSYIVLVTDSNGCKNRDTVIAYVNPIPIANAGPDQVLCIGSLANLTASGGVFYSWNPGGSTTNVISVLTDTTINYIVTVSDSIGCNKKDTVKITINPLPLANAGIDTAVCPNGIATLIANPPGATYLWTPTASTSASLNVSPSIPTIYILEVKDNNGCKNWDTVQVNTFPATIANAGLNQTICSGIPTTLTASGGVSYLWNPGGFITNSITIAPSITTNYIVKVTDINSCIAFDTVVVNVNTYLSGSSTIKWMCIGDIITLSDSGGVTYSWFPGGSTGSSIQISPQNTTNYFVHIVTQIGCLVYDTTHVIVYPLPLVNAGIDKSICLGSNTNLNATGGLYYQWNVSGSIGSSVVVSPSNTTNYIVNVTDLNGCKSKDTVLVKVNQLPNANAGLDQFICLGEVAKLHASGGVSYLWNPGLIGGDSIFVTPNILTSYSVQVIDSNGCKNNDTILVNVNNPPIAEFNTTAPVCEKSPANFINTSRQSATNIILNKWTFDDGASSLNKNPVHVFNNPNNYQVKLFIADRNGCQDSIEHYLEVNANPIIDFSTENGCQDKSIIFNDLSNTTPKIIQWNWSFGDGQFDSFQNPAHTYLHAGVYDINLIATTDSGCKLNVTKPRSVEIYPLPEPSFFSTPENISIMNALVQFTDQSIGGNTWQWNFGDDSGTSNETNPYYAYKDTGSFKVRLILISNFGCIDSSFNEVHISPDFTFYIPNSFTPNGDGINDLFGPSGIGIGDYGLFIYDRWGKNIYHSNDFLNLWDGKSEINNEICENGTYVYFIKVVDYRKMKHEYSGIVSLIK